MGSLSEKLKALGVKTGAEDISATQRGPDIEQVIPGDIVSNQFGQCFLAKAVYPHGAPHGAVELALTQPLSMVGAWSGQPGLEDAEPSSFVFLDTETTGLGGVGTLLFMVGIGRYEKDGFHLYQFFLRNPTEELAMLAAIESLLAGAEHLVTYNGKSFDLPLLQSRFIFNGWERPWKPEAHLDLLHLARRLWRDSLPSKTLGAVEDQILGVKRTDEEVPGWLVPQLYVEYLRSRDAGPMKGVFYHNAMDILSLAGLLDTAAGILEAAIIGTHDDSRELFAVARLCEDLGRSKQAVSIYRQYLKIDDSTPSYQLALKRLSLLYKRMRNHKRAIQLWEEAAAANEIYSFEELAKYYEHTAGDLDLAQHWTHRALKILETSAVPAYDRQLRTAEFEHRLERLRRKIASRG